MARNNHHVAMFNVAGQCYSAVSLPEMLDDAVLTSFLTSLLDGCHWHKGTSQEESVHTRQFKAKQNMRRESHQESAHQCW